MWKCFSRRPAPNPPENPEKIRRQLKAAQLLLQARREKEQAAKATGEENSRKSWKEILPSDEPDTTISYQPLPSHSGDSILAAALESILQGQRVDADLFTHLYRGGFVFKDPGGQWTITASGKDMIEKHKLITPEGCLVAGVKCSAGWNR